MDLRTGQWETHATPRDFKVGIKVTPDGYVLGMFAQYWIYGSQDYGKTWTRLEAWVNMTQPHFLDRRRGVTIASETGLTGSSGFKLRTTEDGGLTWKTGGAVAGAYGWMQPFWTDPAGDTLYTSEWGSHVRSSRDQGKTWR
jgi:hypothetical protein